MKKISLPILMTWVPMGIASAGGSAPLGLIHDVLVLLAAWFVLEKLLARRPG